MVDKVWYDWQHRDATNFWAFEGGSIQNISSLAAINEYPNGMPPALHVSHQSTFPYEFNVYPHG